MIGWVESIMKETHCQWMLKKPIAKENSESYSKIFIESNEAQIQKVP